MRENRDIKTPIDREPVDSGVVGRSKALWVILILGMSALLLRVLLLQTVDYDLPEAVALTVFGSAQDSFQIHEMPP